MPRRRRWHDRGSWRRNLFAVTAASFIGFTGFTLVMPFLPLYIQQLGVDRRRRDRAVGRPEPRRHAGAHRAALAVLGPARRPLRPQDDGRARRSSSFVVVMAAMAFVTRAVARLRAARRAGPVRRLRRADAGDGRRVGAARADGLRDRHRADRAAARPGARAGHRRRAGGPRRPAARLPRDGGVYAVALLVRRCSYVEPRTRRAPGEGQGPRVGSREHPRPAELRAPARGHLRAPVRRPQLRPDPPALRGRPRGSPRRGPRSSRACCSRWSRARRPSDTTWADGC